jgi:hypothetical protein
MENSGTLGQGRKVDSTKRDMRGRVSLTKRRRGSFVQEEKGK